jgi:hypothetical protein
VTYHAFETPFSSLGNITRTQIEPVYVIRNLHVPSKKLGTQLTIQIGVTNCSKNIVEKNETKKHLLLMYSKLRYGK